jgi:hypothetical protein
VWYRSYLFLLFVLLSLEKNEVRKRVDVDPKGATHESKPRSLGIVLEVQLVFCSMDIDLVIHIDAEKRG